MKICTIIGARPQFIKASQISKKMKEYEFSQIIIHTGQHFEKNMSNIFFKEMNIPSPDYNLGINQLEYGEMIDKMVNSLGEIFLREKFDGILVFGDTNSTLAGSVAGCMAGIPIFHIEAGLRSFNRDMHEEVNRIITDHFSTLLFCPTLSAVDILGKEGIGSGIIFSGDIMYDAYLEVSSSNYCNYQAKKIDHDYILSTIHRRENLNSEQKLKTIFLRLDEINKNISIIMPLHPHTKKKIELYGIKSNINFIDPVGYSEMMSLLNNSDLVITDSGGLQKEAFFAKKKCLIVRHQTEWTELVDLGSSLLSDPDSILENYEKILKQKVNFSSGIYGNGNASEIIVKSIINFLK